MQMSNYTYPDQSRGLDRPLPSNEEAEKTILGAIILNNSLLDAVASELLPEELYSPVYRRIYKAMIDLGTANRPINPVFIAEELKREGGIDSMGGVAMITNLTYGLPHFTTVSDYVTEVKIKARLRNLVRVCNEIVADTLEEAEDAETLLDRAEDLIHKAAGSGARNSRLIVWADQAEREAQETYDKLDRGEIVAVPTGFPEVDNSLYGGGFWQGDLVVVSGATSGGKTTFALNLADNAGQLGFRSLYFTLEMKTFKVFSRIHSSKAKVPGYKIRPRMSELYGSGVRERLRSTGAKMANLPIGFIDSVKDLETMRRVCKFAVREYGVSYLLFDYMGLMIPSRNFRGSRYDRASMVSEGLKELAGELNVPVVALSQLRRKYKEEKSAAQVIEGNEVEPSLDMLKESGSIENDADTVIFLWGEKAKEGEETAIREIRGKIAKQRNGKLDRFELRFAPDIFTFKSMSQLTAYRSAEPEF
jgi:replicative DNA helicase